MEKNGFGQKILMGFYIVFTLLMGSLIFISIKNPQNYQSPLRMAIQTVFFTLFFCGGAILWDRYYARFSDAVLKKLNLFAIILSLFVFWAGLYIICVLQGNGYHVPGDYEILYISALETADAKPLTYAHYFLTYSNNTEPMLLLAILFKISHMLGLNEFYPVLLLSSGTVAGSVWAVGELLSGKGKWRVPVLFLIAVCLPVYVFTGAFYTDTMSFGLGLISIAFLKIGLSDKKQWGFLILSGFVASLGAIWKITALIFPIAAGITFLLFKAKELKQYVKKGLLSYLIFAIIFTLGANASFQTVPICRKAKQYANPTSAWVALGLKGNGSYEQNVEFSDAVNALPDREAKSEYVNSYLKENYKEAFSIQHLISKAENNFAGGTFTCSDFTANPTGHSLLWEMMDPGGRYFYGCAGYAFSYMGMIYVMLFIGGVLSVKRLSEKKELSFYKVAADISFFGLFLFLMVWESNNRQLYNQLPVMILAIFGSAELLIGLKEKK